jgi:hypothetical protein
MPTSPNLRTQVVACTHITGVMPTSATSNKPGGKWLRVCVRVRVCVRARVCLCVCVRACVVHACTSATCHRRAPASDARASSCRATAVSRSSFFVTLNSTATSSALPMPLLAPPARAARSSLADVGNDERRSSRSARDVASVAAST